MNIVDLIGPAVIAALVSAVVSVVGVVYSSQTTRKLHGSRIDADQRLAERKIDADLALAQKKVDDEKELGRWKRRVELAEQTLELFYRARASFDNARHPGGVDNEGQTRPNRDEDPDPDKDRYYTTFERLNRDRDTLAALEALKFRFSANFGLASMAHFQAIVSAYNQIRFATQMLMRTETLSDRHFDRFQAVIWADGGDSDQFAKQVADAVEGIEKLCAPILQGEPT